MKQAQMIADRLREMAINDDEQDWWGSGLLREAADEIYSLRDTLQVVMNQKSRQEVASGHQISELADRLAAAERVIEAARQLVSMGDLSIDDPQLQQAWAELKATVAYQEKQDDVEVFDEEGGSYFVPAPDLSTERFPDLNSGDRQ